MSFSAMSFAQFTDNVFDQEQEQTATEQQQNTTPSLDQSSQAEAAPALAPDQIDQQPSSDLVPSGGEHPEGPGNPGEPVPINGYIPLLLLSALALIFYSQRKNKKINI